MSSGKTKSKPDELAELIEGSESIAIICHDNPDPDCIASAMALTAIARTLGVEEVVLFYSGEISHQQNRAFVNLLEIDLREYEEDAETFEDFDLRGFVDHSVKGANNEVPEDVVIDIVIDHHQSENGVDARFVDLREDYAATTTIMAEYIQELGVEVDKNLATAMLFGIRSETLEYTRGTTELEFEVSKFLYRLTDEELLSRIIKPAFSPQTLDTIGEAIRNRNVRASALVSGVGRTSERDALPQSADYLMNLEGISTVLVFGVIEDTVQMSARTNDSRVNIDQVIREAFGDVGSAGGHREMAGAQVPLGIFSEMHESEEKLVDLISSIIEKRFFDAMNLDEEENESDT